MRIVMMGTGPFAVPTFKSLLASSHDLPVLITRPPHQRRGKRPPPPNPMQEVALAAGLDVEMPESIKSAEALDLLRRLAADLFVVCDYGQILSARSLALPRLGGINLHGSLLPAYRGAAPIRWAVYDGCTETGITVIHMTPQLDAGPNLVQRRTAIRAAETAPELEKRLSELGVEAIHTAIDILSDWDGQRPIGDVQDPGEATKAPRLTKTDGAVDWTRSAQQIFDQVRAFKPWPGTYSHWLREGEEPLRVVLESVSVADDLDASVAERPGGVVAVDERLIIATGDGVLQVHAIQPAGRKVQSSDAFLCGYRLKLGDRFGSP